MSGIREAVFARLAGYADLAALVGTKVFHLQVPQGTAAPFVRFVRVSGPRVHSLTGPSGLANPRYQVDAWGRTPTEVYDVAAAVRHALDGYRGLPAAGGIRIEGAVLVSELELFEEETKLYRDTQDFSLWHEEG